MTTTAVAANFLSTQLAFTKEAADGTREDMTFDDLPVPGIGPAGREKLTNGNLGDGGDFEGGISNAAQVVGWYLRQNGDDAAMGSMLVDTCGCHGPSVHKEGSGTLAALREKCAGFVMEAPDEVAMEPEVAAGTTKVFAGFMSKQLSWQDTFDSNPVPGLGQVGRDKLKERDGIERPIQLIGQYMLLQGEEDEFVEYLLECGLRKQEINKENGILHAIREKIAPFCSP